MVGSSLFRGRTRAVAIAWVTALVTAAALLVTFDYRTRDPDSRAYTVISARLADEPVARWIAPEWWGAWGSQGLFREHPHGVFLLPALVIRAGYPAAQASLAVNLACQVLCLLVAAWLASRLVRAEHARVLLWALQILFIAFVFRIRANQEYPLLLGLLVALAGIEKARVNPAWVAVALAGFVYALLVKGVFALLAVPLAALWLLTRRPDGQTVVGAWLGVAAMAIVAPAAALAYEAAYQYATGQSFLAYYLGQRVDLSPGGGHPIATKAYNVIWYTGRVLWYAAPWSLALVAILIARTWRRPESPRPRAAVLAFSEADTARARRGLLFALASAALVVGLVALRDLKADRYVFPAYVLVGAAGAIAAARHIPIVTRVAGWFDRVSPYGEVGLWLVLFGLRLLSGSRLPAFTFWRS